VSVAIDHESLTRFRSLVAERMGLEFPDDKLGDLAEVFRERLSATRLPSGEAYLRCLTAPATGLAEMREVAQHLTVNESYFFRNPNHFRALVDLVIPARLQVPERTGGLRVLSAGCSSGEEAYTVAILLREHPLAAARLAPMSILGVDVNAAVLEKARKGRYTEWSLRATPPAARARWFHSQGNELVLHESIRNMVTFELGNLAEAGTGFVAPRTLDVIFCRNVFIYFSPEAIRATVERFTGALQPGGFLFLGDAESLRGISSEFELCHTHETFYYRLRAPRPRRPVGTLRVPGGLPSISPAEAAWESWSSLPLVTDRPAPAAGLTGGALPVQAPSDPIGQEEWMDAIGQASQRVATLSAGAVRSRSLASPVQAGGWDLAPIRQLMATDREAEALAAIAALPPAAEADAEVRLVRAMLLTNRGDLAGAERICRELLVVDEFNAGAHYLLAVSCEQRSALADALEHDRIATYLDPDFAMPRLHFGRLARRAGNVQRARQELTRALELIEWEDPSRLALFAGGFSRERLSQICRTELLACIGDG
jgi:chemotaxis protein methyltransferase CheR